MSEVVEERSSLLLRAGLLSVAAAQHEEGTIKQATYLMRLKSVQSLNYYRSVWVPCRSERNGEALATVNCYLAPFANIPLQTERF